MGPGVTGAGRARGPTAGEDLGWRAVLVPLFDALTPSSVLACSIDAEPDPNLRLPGADTASVTACRPEEFADAVGLGGGPDIIWLRGHPNWHTVRALAADIIDHFATRPTDPPVLVVECDRADPLPAWIGNDTYAAQLHRQESAKEGVRLSVVDLAEQLDPDALLLWCAPGRGTAVLVPSVIARRFEPWIDGQRAVLDAMSVTHLRHAELVAQNFALFELLEGSQRSGDAVVRSKRFRLGTRLARLANKLTRRNQRAVFRAPRQILARQVLVEQWRSRLAAERESEECVPAPNALRVTYLLPQLRLTGGALVVTELVNELRLLGADARIATLEDRQDVYRTRFLDRPMVFGDVPAMVQQLPVADVLVATHWSSAAWVRELVDSGRATHAAYLVQDYETWFYPEDDVQTREKVKQTYGLIPHKIVTSEWLADRLARDGYAAVHKIPPGLDLDAFYPRPVEPSSGLVVLAMARPRTTRRGFDTVVRALAKVNEAVPSVEIVLFGENLGEMALPFPYRREGVVTDQEHLAQLYTEAAVHLDASDFQAFGKAALEAMACGAPSVLTNVGGVNEYARDGENCLLVPPRDPDATARAILTLLSDASLHERLREGGLATVGDYSTKRKARQTLELFEGIVASSVPS